MRTSAGNPIIPPGAGQIKLDWALHHVAQSWAILPVWWIVPGGRCACGKAPGKCKVGKHPLWIKGSAEHGANSATTDEAQVRRWWSQYPDANIGGATGRKSGRVVLNEDPRNGGADTLAQRVTVRPGFNESFGTVLGCISQGEISKRQGARLLGVGTVTLYRYAHWGCLANRD